MFDRIILKTRAKEVMARFYFPMLIACVITGLVGGGLGVSYQRVVQTDFSSMSYVRMMSVIAVMGVLMLIALAFAVFLTAPLGVGLKKFMLDTAEGDCRLEKLLFPFKNEYKNIVIAQLMKSLVIFLWSLPALIPWIIGIWKFGLLNRLEQLYNAVSGASPFEAAMKFAAIMWFMMLLTVIFSIPAVIKQLQYSMTEYILADNPGTPWRTALDQSKEMMAGNKWGYVKLRLSFLGWSLVAGFLCCIGNVFVLPYIEATTAQLYLELCGRGGTQTQTVYY